jgi:hypothetical protein
MKITTIAVSTILTAAALAASLAACDGNQGYYAQPYVIGTYTCASPLTGLPDYCVEYSDGTSSIVPYAIYRNVYYGSTLTYISGHYSYSRPAVLRRAPDVYHVAYHAHSYTGYSGMSYVSKGRVVYRGASTAGYSHSGPYRSSWSGRH